MTLYPRALTGTEIQGIYTEDGGGKCRTPAVFPIGDLASGATWTLTLVAVPTNCIPVFATATVSGASPVDPNLANNTATSLPVIVQDLPASQVRLTIQRVSLNNTSAEICWPLTCAPWTLQATGSLNPPIAWAPIIVPVQQIGSRNCTVVPAGTGLQYYRLQSP